MNLFFYNHTRASNSIEPQKKEKKLKVFKLVRYINELISNELIIEFEISISTLV